MNILDQIVQHKRKEVAELKRLLPIQMLEQSVYFRLPVLSMKEYLLREGASGIIAEIKRKSPSRGMINPNASIDHISVGYMQAGATALSVLTDSHYFGGSMGDLIAVRKYNYCPILRKEFILDEYQVVESKSIGADAILLIAAILEPRQLKQLCQLAHSLGMEVLMEVHNEEEIEKNLDGGADMIGVNNRNLKTFEVSLEKSMELAASIPGTSLAVSESGIVNPADVIELRRNGYKGFLVGEAFMKYSRPELAAGDFIREIRELEK